MDKFIDLFCGVGGFRLAMEKHGMECVFSSDINSHAQQVYSDNFHEKPVGDIRDIPERSIPDHDILCAGFPCQSFSISGKKLGIHDERGRLFYEIIRIAKYHKPFILLLENVKNILSIDGGGTVKKMEEKLGNIGYDVEMHILNSSYFGIPQARERVYFVCLKKGSGLSYKKPRETNKAIFLENILMNKDDCKELVIDRDDVVLYDRPENEYQLKPIRIGHVNKASQGERIYSVKGHSVTIAATTGGAGANTGLYKIDDIVRRLHIDECKKLMGFPNSHKLSNGREGYKQLGNAVIPEMIEHVYENIKIV